MCVYHTLRSSNLLVLPSERTLRDYTHFIKAKAGFQGEVDHQLCRGAKDCQKFVCLMSDKVKIKEDLVYDKHSGEVVGFGWLVGSAYRRALCSFSVKSATLA